MSANIWNHWSQEKQEAFIQASNDHIAKELAVMFNISNTTVKRIRQRLGLKCSQELYLQLQRSRAVKMNELWKDQEFKSITVTKIKLARSKQVANERRRIRNCLPQRTKLNLLPYADTHVKRNKLYNARSYLFSRGYIPTDDIHILLYNDITNQVNPKKQQQYLDNYRLRLIHVDKYDPVQKILTIHDHLIAGERNFVN